MGYNITDDEKDCGLLAVLTMKPVEAGSMTTSQTITSSVRYHHVANSPGYRIGDNGDVQTSKRGVWKSLKPETANGYYRVNLGRGNKRYVHHLVAEAFIGPRPEGQQVRHLDGDRKNNLHGNLAYGSPKENSQDAVRHGTTNHGEKNPFVVLTEAQVLEIRQLESSGIACQEIALRYGVCSATIGYILRGATWKRLPGGSPDRVKAYRKGERAPNAKLTDDQVREIFRLRGAGLAQKVIGSMYGISQAAVWYILHGRNWKHIQEES